VVLYVQLGLSNIEEFGICIILYRERQNAKSQGCVEGILAGAFFNQVTSADE